MSWTTARLLTVGHGTLSAGECTALVTGADAELLVDVRSHPASRPHPESGATA